MTIDHNTLASLVRNACFAADGVAIASRSSGDTPAQTTRKAITRALEALEGNGLITVTPPDEWNPWFAPDPPYSTNLAPIKAETQPPSDGITVETYALPSPPHPGPDHPRR